MSPADDHSTASVILVKSPDPSFLTVTRVGLGTLTPNELSNAPISGVDPEGSGLTIPNISFEGATVGSAVPIACAYCDSV